MTDTKKFSWGGTALAGQTTADGTSNPLNVRHLNKAIQVNCLAGAATVIVKGSIDGGVSYPFTLATLALATATTASAGYTGTGAYDSVALQVSGSSGATINGYARSMKSNF